MYFRRVFLAAALLFCVAGATAAQALDQTDLTFWQSIQNSKDPAEYQAYLTAFPKGIFAELAHLRLQQLQGGAAPAAAPEAPAQAQNNAPAQAPNNAPLSDASFTISPEHPRVGNRIKVMFADMPTPSIYDKVIIVAAGSSDKVGTSNSDGVVANTSIANEYTLENGWDAGTLAPGAYEVRWLTTLYNNENRLEVAARSEFEVSR